MAETQANLAKYYAEAAIPAPLGSKISVPANTKVPDGYEPVWYKNTITRQRYPDFFKQLVDTNYLIYVDETILMNIMYSLNVALMEIGKNGIVCLFWLMKAMLLN